MNVTLITDASWCPDQLVSGYGYWVACARGKLGGGGRCTSASVETSTVAEMMGVCNSLFECYKAGYIVRGDRILIQTDCVAAIKAFEGIRFANLNRQERMVVKYLHELQKALDLELTFRHVKAHTQTQDARSVTNRMCDKVAKKFMREARNSARIRAIKEMFLNGVDHAS